MLGAILEWVFPSPKPREPTIEDVARSFASWHTGPPKTIEEKAALLRAVGNYPPKAVPVLPILEEVDPPKERTPREAGLTGLASCLDQVARRGTRRMQNATPWPEPDPWADPSELRRYALREVRERVELYCIGEIQNQRPELALEFKKAWDSFNALWNLMANIDPKDIKKRR